MKHEHAIVIGAGFSGLICAKMLSRHFDSVTILERSESISKRYANESKFVPQQNHAHHLLFQGKRIIDKYFPNYHSRLIEKGGKIVDYGADFRFFQYGNWRSPTFLGAPMYLAERPLLEGALLNDVQSKENINILWGASFRSIHSQHRSGGAAVVLENDARQELKCDLCVNASGRWLKQVDDVKSACVNIWYTTFFLELSDFERPDWTVLIGYNRRPQQRVACYAGYTAPGYNRLQFTVMTYGERPPADRGKMIDYLEANGPAHQFSQLLTLGKSPGRGEQLAFTHMYMDQGRPPAHQILLGDSACSIDPVTGVGITKAALEVEILDEALQHNTNIAKVCRRFHRRAHKVRRTAWDFLREQNKRFEKDKDSLSLFNKYIDALMISAQYDEVIFKRFVEVRNLVRPISSFMSLEIVIHVVWQTIKSTLFPRHTKAYEPELPKNSRKFLEKSYSKDFSLKGSSSDASSKSITKANS